MSDNRWLIGICLGMALGPFGVIMAMVLFDKGFIVPSLIGNAILILFVCLIMSVSI